MECAKSMPGGGDGKKLLCQSILNGLGFADFYIKYVRRQLESSRECPWDGPTSDYVAKHTMAGLMFLASALDGFVILDAAGEVSGSLSFKRTPLSDPAMMKIQESINGLQSTSIPTNKLYADFWTIWDFFKHYNAHSWFPSHFDRQDVYDFFVPFRISDDEEKEQSGPVYHDLIVPTFDLAVQLASLFAEKWNVELPSTLVRPPKTKT